MLKIFITEDITSYNKGEGAILYGLLEAWRKAFKEEIKVTLYSSFPETDAKNYADWVTIVNGPLLTIPPHRHFGKKTLQTYLGLAAKYCQYFLFAVLIKLSPSLANVFFKGEIWRTYQEADIIMIGHGNSFATLNIFLIYFCKLLNKCVVSVGGSITKRKKIAEKILKHSVDRLDLLTLRENISYNYLKKIGVSNPRVHVTADPAFLLKPASPHKAKEIFAQESISLADKPLIGMTVAYHSGVFFNSFKEVSDLTKKYELHIKTIARLVDFLTTKLNAQVIFLPHKVGPTPLADDRNVAKGVYSLITNKGRVSVIANEYSPDELKGIIAECDFFIGERTHSVIGAASLGVPFVAISHANDFRTHGILGEMVAKSENIYNAEYMTYERLLKKVLSAWATRKNIRADLLARQNELFEAAYQNGRLTYETWQKFSGSGKES